MHKNKKLLRALFFFVFFAGISLVMPEAQAQGLQYTLLEKIPGTDNLGSDLPGYLKALYNVALVIIVLSAVLMLSIGGFMYLTSAGNTAALSTAKSVIFDALIGLMIALAAYLLLFVINPDLVKVSINGLSPISVTPTPGAPAGPSGPYVGPAVGGCIGCKPVTGVSVKPVGEGCTSPGPCQLNETFLNKLQNINIGQSWWITEAWPPTVTHDSPCHSNGTCADINFTEGVSDVNSVKTFYTAIKEAGFNTVYETFSSCDPYISAGIPCKRFNTTTGSHFHVY